MTTNTTRYPRNWSWPNGAKIAVSVNMAFEGFVRRSQYVQEKTSNEKDYFSLSYADYAWKSGAWRIMDLLDDLGVRGSVSTNGMAAEEHPHVVKAFADQGNEIVSHGWANDELSKDTDPNAERDEIRRVTQTLTEVSGKKPTGWVSSGGARSRNTMDLLTGEGYLWSADDASDDLPFLRDTANGKMVVMPKTNIPHNDLIMFVIGRSSPNIIWDGFKDSFDQLYREGERGSPKWTEMTLHSHIAGRPTFIPVYRRCVEYARQHDAVWFATKGEIAAWALKHESRA